MEWIIGILVVAFFIRPAIFLPQERRAEKLIKQLHYESEILDSLRPYMITTGGRHPLRSTADMPQIFVAQVKLLEIEAKAKSWNVPAEYHERQVALLNVVAGVRDE